jgi:fumarate reductase subunit D
MEYNQKKELSDLSSEKKVSIYSRLWVVPSYFWVLAFVPYFLKRRNEFVFFHAKQGVVLFITEIILIFLSCIPIVGQLISLLGSIFCFYLSLRAMISGLKGEKWILPLIGKYTRQLK